MQQPNSVHHGRFGYFHVDPLDTVSVMSHNETPSPVYGLALVGNTFNGNLSRLMGGAICCFFVIGVPLLEDRLPYSQIYVCYALNRWLLSEGQTSTGLVFTML